MRRAPASWAVAWIISYEYVARLPPDFSRLLSRETVAQFKDFSVLYYLDGEGDSEMPLILEYSLSDGCTPV